MKMDKKTILITGSGSGLGFELAIGLAALGHVVFAGTRRPDRLKKRLREYGWVGQNLNIVSLDVASDRSVGRSIEKILKQVGKLDMLINNAGYGVVGATENVSSGRFGDILDINLLGPARCIRRVLPAMRKRKSGTIINIGSVSGVVASPFLGAYCATKAGLGGLTESLAMELKKYGIRVALVEPGLFGSDFVENSTIENARKDNPYFKEVNDYIGSIKRLDGTDKIQSGREVADEIIKNVIFTKSERFRFQTNAWSEKIVRAKLKHNSLVSKIR